jgi:hypothetical protein
MTKLGGLYAGQITPVEMWKLRTSRLICQI